jgi:hypothetical protein
MKYGVNSSGNPDVVPAKAGIYTKETGFLFAQETLDSPVSSTGQAYQVRNDKICEVISE